MMLSWILELDNQKLTKTIYYITPTYNCEELDSRKIKALAEVPGPFEALGKRICKKLEGKE